MRPRTVCRRSSSSEQFGAELLLLQGVAESRVRADGPAWLKSVAGDEVEADIVIVAPGMDWRKLPLEGIDALLGRGVYYGAGRSEARHCSDDDVVVVGAGNSAGQAVMNLSEAGARVTMVVRGGDPAVSMSAYLVERIRANDRIRVRLHTQVTELHAGQGHLSAVSVTE